MTAVVNIISEHIPELVALDLSSNRLTSLETLEKLVDRTPHVQGLDLSNNEVILSVNFSIESYLMVPCTYVTVETVITALLHLVDESKFKVSGLMMA